jgi:hypothetical protein
MKAILNYTTSIAVDKTTGEITRILREHGASRVTIDYDQQGNPSALAFWMGTARGDHEFRLPANIPGVWRALTRQQQSGAIPPRLATKEQAARVGWRIVKDWLEAQIAIIEAGMATVDEVLLPYLLAPSGRTVYEEFVAHRLALPERGSDGAATREGEG